MEKINNKKLIFLKLKKLNNYLFNNNNNIEIINIKNSIIQIQDDKEKK